MSRTTYIWDRETRKMVPKSETPPVSAGPSVIGDIQDVRSVLDGKVYSSRRHYRDHVKSRGCEIVGNDFNNQPMERERPDVPGLVDDIKRAMGERS